MIVPGVRWFTTLARPFNQIPTLKSYPIIGHGYLFLLPGGYRADKLTEAVEDLSNQLGSIFTLKLSGLNIVITTDADDARTLFQNEGKLPHRPTFPALYHYRKNNFHSVGIVPGNGEEWYQFRTGANVLLKSSVIKFYQKGHTDIAKRFVDHIESNRRSDFIIEDLFNHLLKFTVEAISLISPGYLIKCLNEENEKSKEIINASVDFMDGLYSTLIGLPTWRFYKSPGYRKLESAHIYVHGLIKDHLEHLKELYSINSENVFKQNPFFHELLTNDRMSWDDVMMLSLETFFGGIDATATTLTMTLHQLSLCERAQRRARQEAVIGKGTSYVRACLQETLRLQPTAGANSRFTDSDCVIHGYRVPKGTLVTVFSSVTSRSGKYFENSDSYLPERWLRNVDGQSVRQHHPFASLPFGHGPRMCPGRRIAFQEMEILLQEILKRYHVLPVNHEPFGLVYRMNRVPDRKLNLKFVDINTEEIAGKDNAPNVGYVQL